jgi:hypothetical protein
MRILSFERYYGHLADSEDAVKVLGMASLEKGLTTVGDIRRACAGRPKDASIYPDITNACGFYVTEVHGKFFTV